MRRSFFPSAHQPARQFHLRPPHPHKPSTGSMAILHTIGPAPAHHISSPAVSCSVNRPTAFCTLGQVLFSARSEVEQQLNDRLGAEWLLDNDPRACPVLGILVWTRTIANEAA